MEKLTVTEFIAAIEKPLVKGEARAVNLSDLYEHFKLGHFRPTDILEFYRQRESPRFVEAVRLFERGLLFKAQTQSFDSWCAGDYKAVDVNLANAYLSVEDAAQFTKDPGLPANIRSFIWRRVYAKRPGAFSDTVEQDNYRKAWVEENLRMRWQTWAPNH